METKAEFCAYIHSRPNGVPFYVGKGRIRRAKEMSPSRRTSHHKNIVAKHGRNKILVCIFPCKNEEDAFDFEKYWIKKFKDTGVQLINITEGGEGACGRVATKKQLKGLSKGRGPGHFHKMSKRSKRAILDGLAVGRSKLKDSVAFQNHLKVISKIGVENFKKLREENLKRVLICDDCGVEFKSASSRAMCCSKKCQQRRRRSRESEIINR